MAKFLFTFRHYKLNLLVHISGPDSTSCIIYSQSFVPYIVYGFVTLSFEHLVQYLPAHLLDTRREEANVPTTVATVALVAS